MVFLEGSQIHLQQIHVGFRVRVEWGISELRSKCRKLMKCLDSTKEKYNNLFKFASLLTIFLHKHHQDFIIEVISEHHND